MTVMGLSKMNKYMSTRQGQGTPHNIGVNMDSKKRMDEAMKHPNILGAGAKKRKHLKGKEKVGVVMKEFKKGTLHSGSGKIVKKRKQAVAIAMSEAGLSKK